jgi:predicted DNA-binding transcriptional regulator AlpA
MRAEHASLYVGISPSAWRELVRRRLAPAPVYITGRIPVWLREDLDRWLDSRAGRAANSLGFASNPWDEP